MIVLISAPWREAVLRHVLSRFRLPLAVVASMLLLAGGEGGGAAGESPRPLAVLAIGSENRRNVGQLCHPFEVGTACLWSGGRVLSFHVLLSCDLGRPQLHKKVLNILPSKQAEERKDEEEKNTGKTYSGTYGARKAGALWSEMNERWESAGSFKASPWQDSQRDKHWNVFKYWLVTCEISKGFKGVMWQLISGCVII